MTLVQLEPNLSRAVADFHTAFNLVIALAFLPLLPWLARLLERAMPARVGPADPGRPLYLDESAVETPSIALGHASREALRMVDVLDSMIEAAADALRLGDREAIARARRQDDVLDALSSEIKRYLTRLDPESLTDDEHRRVEAVLTFSLNLESAGDVIERNIGSFVAKRLKRGIELSADDDREMQDAFEAVRVNLRSAASVFMTGDRRAARILSQQKAEFRRREGEAIKAHFARAPGSIETPLRRRSISCVTSNVSTTTWSAGAAYPVLEAAGELMPSRIVRGRRSARRRADRSCQGTDLLAATAMRFANAATSFLRSGSLISGKRLAGLDPLDHPLLDLGPDLALSLHQQRKDPHLAGHLGSRSRRATCRR